MDLLAESREGVPHHNTTPGAPANQSASSHSPPRLRFMSVSPAPQAAYPARIHQIHVINAPSYMSTIEGLIKPFIKKKIQDRVSGRPLRPRTAG